MIPTPLTIAQTKISLTYANPSHNRININIDSGNNAVRGVTLHMTYIPQSITYIAIAPGNFFDIPIIYLRNIDTSKGTILLGLGVNPNQKGKRGTGILATIIFTQSAPSSLFTPIILPTTFVTVDGRTESGLESIKSL